MQTSSLPSVGERQRIIEQARLAVENARMLKQHLDRIDAARNCVAPNVYAGQMLRRTPAAGSGVFGAVA